MPAVSHRLPINAPAERLWNLLLRKTEHPEESIAGVTGVVIEERSGPTSLVRRMQLGPGGPVVRELIVIDATARTIVFKGLGDPASSVTVLNIVYTDIKTGGTYLEYVMSGGEGFDAASAQRTITAAVEAMRRLAEQGQ